MGLWNGIGNGIGRKKRGIDWRSYWATHSPSGLVVTNYDTSIKLDWTDGVEAPDGIRVYVDTVEVDTVAHGVGTYTITGLTELTEYDISVVGYSGSEESTALTSTTTTYRYRYVRPLGGAYGAEDGSTYANAWDGFADIAWAEVVPNTVVWICGTHNEALTVGASGLESQHIIFRGDYTGDPGVIDGTDTLARCVGVIYRNYTEWRNLTILQATMTCINFANGTHWMYDCTITDSGDQNTEVNTGGLVYLTRCTIERAADDGSSSHDTGKYIINDCDYNANATAIAGFGSVEIYDSRFNGNTKDGVVMPIIIASRCYFKPPANAGVIIGTKSSLVSYCLIDLREYTAALTLFVQGTIVLNNCTIIADNVGYIRDYTGSSYNFNNCILYDLNRIGSNEAGTLNTTNCNLYSSGILNIDTNTAEVTGDPKFTNFAGNDFTLAADSPCRGAGVTGLGYTKDYAGNPVPTTGIDVGCYQCS